MIRQINYLVIPLVNALFSRNLRQKVRVNFCNFHKVARTVWKFQDFSATQILNEIDFGHFEAQKLPF